MRFRKLAVNFERTLIAITDWLTLSYEVCGAGKTKLRLQRKGKNESILWQQAIYKQHL